MVMTGEVACVLARSCDSATHSRDSEVVENGHCVPVYSLLFLVQICGGCNFFTKTPPFTLGWRGRKHSEGM